MQLKHTLAPLALLFALAFSACGGSDGNSNGQEETSPEPITAGGSAGVVDVKLLEWAISGADPAAAFRATSGEATFEVENIGGSPHELAVIRTDTDPADLPYDDAELIVDEDTAGEVIGRTELLDAGQSETLTLDLEPGTYALICNIATHYEQGMHTQLDVD